MFNNVEFIEKKRDGGIHTREEINSMVSGIMNGTVRDYQISAWLMASFLKGLNDDETMYLTEALAASGEKISYPESMHVMDKHSTGGVGDKTTIIFVPLAAACGVKISKLSGPGLGYTGGTVDKLESIPGMKLHLTESEFKEQVEKIGCAVSGHSLKLAPAEGMLYKLRDVTGTVPSVALITSSIISKKLAGGASAYVFDVKSGSGAFMKNREEACSLAENLVAISSKLGKKSAVLITDMEQPLGKYIGNAAEVYEAIEVLSGRGPDDTRKLSILLGASVLVMSDIASNFEEGKTLCAAALDSGSALNKFKELIEAQHGDSSILQTPEVLISKTKYIFEIKSPRTGFVSKLDALCIGEALRALGGGRLRMQDEIDPYVSIELCAKIGDKIDKDGTIIKAHYDDERQIQNAAPYLKECFEISDKAEKRKLVIDHIL